MAYIPRLQIENKIFFFSNICKMSDIVLVTSNDGQVLPVFCINF